MREKHSENLYSLWFEAKEAFVCMREFSLRRHYSSEDNYLNLQLVKPLLTYRECCGMWGYLFPCMLSKLTNGLDEGDREFRKSGECQDYKRGAVKILCMHFLHSHVITWFIHWSFSHSRSGMPGHSNTIGRGTSKQLSCSEYLGYHRDINSVVKNIKESTICSPWGKWREAA